MKIMLAVFRKEWIDLMRDRRTVLIGLAMGALLAPGLVIGINVFAVEKLTQQYEAVLKLPVKNAELAPNLINWLSQRNVEVVEPPPEIDTAIRSQQVDLVLEIHPEYPQQWLSQMPARIDIYYDASRESARVARSRVNGLLDTYSNMTGRLRLMSRGIDPDSSWALTVVPRDLSTEASKSGQSLAFLPYFLILTAFLGGAYFVIDTTAGERERESLESILLAPTPASDIMLGKVMATAGFGLLMTFVALLAFKLSFSFAPNLIAEMKLSWAAAFGIWCALAPISVLGVSLLTLISATTKTVKEAQSYMSVLMLLPIIPSLILMINPIKTEIWMYSIPFLSQNQLITTILRGEVLTLAELGVYAGSQMLITMVILGLAAVVYSSEKMALGR